MQGREEWGYEREEKMRKNKADLPCATAIARSHATIVLLLGRWGRLSIVVKAVGSPALIPDHAAGLPQLRAPVGEDGVLQAYKVTVLSVIWVCESPGESAADWFITSCE